jgi:GTP-binding protein Era
VEGLPAGYRSGFVAVVGRPNVGKSTLLNRFLEQKVAAVSPRPQTTRRKQLGILSLNAAQVVFIDTPGIHKPVHKLGEWMVQAALDAVRDADLALWLVDASAKPAPEDRLVGERLSEAGRPVMLVLNKIDLLSADQRAARTEAYVQLAPQADTYFISAVNGEGCAALLEALLGRLPEGPPFYDTEQVTDLYEREIAIDLIREALLRCLEDEVPHATAVRLEEYKDRGEDAAYIAATLLVERESHKGITIGKGGEMLKRIGSLARQEIESMTGRKVFLELRVKVLENWRNNPTLLKQLGYRTEKF